MLENKVLIIKTEDKKEITFIEYPEARAYIELLFLDKLGYSPVLQETDESEEFNLWIHTDTYEVLEDYQLQELHSLNISKDYEDVFKAITTLLDIDVYMIKAYTTQNIYEEVSMKFNVDLEDGSLNEFNLMSKAHAVGFKAITENIWIKDSSTK